MSSLTYWSQHQHQRPLLHSWWEKPLEVLGGGVVLSLLLYGIASISPKPSEDVLSSIVAFNSIAEYQWQGFHRVAP